MSLVEDWQRYGFSQVIYRKRTRHGEIVELVPLDPDSIRPLVNPQGEQPQPPYPAWEYFERGIPVAFFTQDDIEVTIGDMPCVR